MVPGEADSAPVATVRPTSRPTKRASAKSDSQPSAEPNDSFPARFDFDHFVPGPSNRLAHAGAIAVAADPGAAYNPLFLYGPAGTGKTHLLLAIGRALALSGNKRVAYVGAEDFTSQYVAALRERRIEDFRRRWRRVDVFLVDDIQFIAGKEHTKEEFFHTFNALLQSGSQIVIASDRTPRDLHTVDVRLRSRFESGLVADLGLPDYETRVAILQRRLKAERIVLADDVVETIARLVESNVRTLEGALTKVLASTSLLGEIPDIEQTTRILSHYTVSDADSTAEIHRPGRRSQRGRITPDLIQRVVAERFQVSTDQLVGKRRDRAVAHARHVAMHLTRELTGASLLGIGQLYGGRDHSTVAHACDRIRSQAGADQSIQLLLEEIVQELQGHGDIG
jgi:chromosomal replication initiator protein